MAKEVKARRRKYDSPLRTAQAQGTKERILEAAFGLFADRGYAGTTIAAVAERANVAPETIYLSVGNKRDLLAGVIEKAIAGDAGSEEDDEAWAESVAQLAEPEARLERLVGYSCEILGRTQPIHRVIRGAADKEPFAAELGKRLLHDRLAGQTQRLRRHLRGDLRKGVSVAEAGQRFCALASPELYHLLTVDFGWTAEQHRRWVTDTLTTDLLRQAASRSAGAGR